MQSKKKPMETIELSSLGIDESNLTPKTGVTGYREKPPREAGQKFEGEPADLAQKVAKLLDEEANLI